MRRVYGMAAGQRRMIIYHEGLGDERAAGDTHAVGRLQVEVVVMADEVIEAYLIEVTTPSGEKRRELYHTEGGVALTVGMYARSEEAWVTEVFPLVKMVPGVGLEPTVAKIKASCLTSLATPEK